MQPKIQNVLCVRKGEGGRVDFYRMSKKMLNVWGVHVFFAMVHNGQFFN